MDIRFCALDVETHGGTWQSFPEGFQLVLVGVREGDAFAAYTAEPESLAQLAGFLDDYPGVVVTYNGGFFDLPVLDWWFQRVLGRPLRVRHHYDLMKEIEKLAGYRIGLDRLAQYTIGAAKVPWDHRWNERVWAEEPHRLIDYNRVDVDLTHDLFARVLRGEQLFLGNTTVTPQAPSLDGADRTTRTNETGRLL